MSAKLVPIESARLVIADDVREAVLRALNANYPFVMVAQRPNGQWETSCHYRTQLSYEVVGALESLKNYVLFGDDEDDD